WTQPIGYAHAIWEVALAALRGAADPKDKESVKQSIANLTVDTIVGPVRFKDTPIKNVAVTSMAGGQWRKTKNGRFPFELLIVYNATAPQIPVEAELKLLAQLGWADRRSLAFQRGGGGARCQHSSKSTACGSDSVRSSSPT